MKIYANQLPQKLQQGLQSVYLIFGDEPLQKIEAMDAIRAAAKHAGFEERQTLTADNSFDWQELTSAFNELSLFSSQKLIELELPTGKPGQQGSKVLTGLSELFNPDTILVIHGAKLDANTPKSKWFKTLDSSGLYIPVYPIEGKHFHRWLREKSQSLNLNIEPQALDLLADFSAGNMLAASQELHKLALAHQQQPISFAYLQSILLNQSRFNVFQLIDALLAGNIEQGINILVSLQQEEIEPTIINWALSREALLLFEMKTALLSGQNQNEVFKAHKIWSSKQGLYQSALQQMSMEQLQQLVDSLANIDKQIKSFSGFNPFTAFAHVILSFRHHQQLSAYAC